MEWVLKNSRQSGSTLTTLLTIASYTNERIGYAWATVPTIAQRAKLSDRTVQRDAVIAKKAGELEIDIGPGKGRIAQWRIVTERDRQFPLANGDNATPFDEAKGDNLTPFPDAQMVTNTTKTALASIFMKKIRKRGERERTSDDVLAPTPAEAVRQQTTDPQPPPASRRIGDASIGKIHPEPIVNALAEDSAIKNQPHANVHARPKAAAKMVRRRHKPKNGSRTVAWPEEFTLTEERRAVALRHGREPDHEWQRFKARALRDGRKYVNWDGAWIYWCSNEFGRHGNNAAGSSNPGSKSMEELFGGQR